MPLPNPKEGEKEQAFVSRCVSAVFEEGTLQGKELNPDSEKDRKQATAACYTQWREDKAVESNTLKAIAETDDELRVANYLARFGGRDLEGIASPRINPDGSKGEYFTPATEFESAYTKTGVLYVDWEHGERPHPEEPGADDVLGYVDWSTAKADSNGLWVERVLNRRNEYMRFLEELIKATYHKQ